MKRRFGLALVALLAVVPAVLAVAASAPAQGGPGSSLGVQIVRFVRGTAPAQMRADVANAGGTVVADLSAANALAVLPGSASFSSAIAAQPGVAGSFSDRPVDGLHGRDDGHGGGPGHGPPGDGKKGASAPDPWHDLPSFWDETNPTGILQWDDDRMDVPDAWKRTTGSSSVDVAVLDSGVDTSTGSSSRSSTRRRTRSPARS